MTTFHYSDVASFQDGVNLFGERLVFCKATQGTGYVNPAYESTRREADKRHAYFAAYHFLSDHKPMEQARFAHDHIGHLPTMVDVEPDTQAGTYPTLGDALVFIDHYRKLGGVIHLAYFPKWYWVVQGEPSLRPLARRKVRLVSSDYGVRYTRHGRGWKSYGHMRPIVWQYSQSHDLNGMTVDYNSFRGSERQFINLIKTGKK